MMWLPRVDGGTENDVLHAPFTSAVIPLRTSLPEYMTLMPPSAEAKPVAVIVTSVPTPPATGSILTMALTETKGRKKPFVVKPLVIDAPPDKAAVGSQLLVGRIKSAPDQAALEAITADTDVMKQRAYLAKNRPELAALVDDAVASALARFAPEAEGMET